MHKPVLGCFILTLGLAGCAQPPAPVASSPPSDPSGVDCDAGKVREVIGQLPTPALQERARTDAGAQVVRVLRHDQVVTLEFRAGRLSLTLDATGRIATANCG